MNTSNEQRHCRSHRKGQSIAWAAPLFLFDILSRICRFCLHPHFRQTAQNRLKWSRTCFCSFSQKEALKSKEFRNRFCHKHLPQPLHFQSSIFNFQNAISTWQNRHFQHVFAHFSAGEVHRRRMGKFQSQRAALANFACGVGNRPVRRWQIPRFEPCFSPFCEVCNN